MARSQKRWCDVAMSDMKRNELYSDWHQSAQEWPEWHKLVKLAAEDFNEHLEGMERDRKDE